MADPESAKIALNANFPEIILAGNAANQVTATPAFFDEVYQVKNPYTELAHKYYGFGFPFWDETAAALMANKSIATSTTTGSFSTVSIIP
jgi:inosine-uridine nucleoside N-ribohydrolase